MAVCVWMGLAGLAPTLAFSIGPEGGLNFSSIPVMPNTQTLTDLLDDYTEGLYADFSLGSFLYLQTEMRITGKGTYDKEQIIVADNSNNPIGYYQQFESISLNYLEWPVMLKLEDSAGGDWRVHVLGGPYVAYLIGASDHVDINGNGFLSDDSFDLNVLKDYNRLDYGLVFGVGLVFKKTFVDFRFDLGLNGLAKNADPPNLQNRTFSLLFGYEFF